MPPVSTQSAETDVLVVGNGMASHRFCAALRDLDAAHRIRITVIGEERWPAYDRVRLTSYFLERSAERLLLAAPQWYSDHGIDLLLGERVARIDRAAKEVFTDSGRSLRYGRLVLATGSRPFVPPTEGIDRKGVFLYRTLDDLDAIIAYASQCRSAAVIGGGLLGLEAAKAVQDLGLDTHVVERAERLMPRQLDETGGSYLAREIERRGVKVRVNHSTEAVTGNGAVTGLRFAGGEILHVDMVVVSAGIQPRDELARACGLEIGARGGVVVNDALESSDPSIHAIGEVACHRGIVYGLVAPGYQMAETLARRLAGGEATFNGSDLSTKLKLLGVDVASVGDPFASGESQQVFEHKDPAKGVYSKVVLGEDGRRVIGGILVGDVSAFELLAHHARTGDPLGVPVASLFDANAPGAAAGLLSDAAPVCSCHNVGKGTIRARIRDGTHELGALQACTQAGTGCGGCLPLVKEILKTELKALGILQKNTVCEHFAMSRKDLLHAVKIRRVKTFDEALDALGTGDGCEVCKPVVASILASLWNAPIIEQTEIQDTNDRFLANIQRGGSYSIVPRVPGGEITPEKLIALGTIAKKYDLYCKITGGQRIDLLGARVGQLPEIWEALIAAGFESGHAYGKAVRTVKSCVGQTWCRYGVQDSTAFAIRIEERYRGIRAPHKLKFAVSGCVRECAEAQSKDVGLVATEKGWNLYVCGNGGARPRHADLLAADVDEETAIRFMDRLLMYYILTADPLTRTSVWLEKLEGGIEHLRQVVVNDSLRICETLEADMAKLVATYACEWKAVVENPVKRALFKHFAGTPAPDPDLRFVRERGQKRPADRPQMPDPAIADATNGGAAWWRAGEIADFPEGRGIAVEYGNAQIAVFNFSRRGEWYATQNLCPHKRDMVLARGLLGDKAGEPKVACPQHKKQFSLESGRCLSGGDLRIQVFKVKLEDGAVHVLLPPVERLGSALECGAACSTAT